MFSTARRMSAVRQPSQRPATDADSDENNDTTTRVECPDVQDTQDLEELYRSLSVKQFPGTVDEPESAVHREFTEFLEHEKETRANGGRPLRRLAVRFNDITTWGLGGESASVKTLRDAVVRTAILRDVYEWTIKPWFRKPTKNDARPLIRNISGAVRDGEMMLYVPRHVCSVSIAKLILTAAKTVCLDDRARDARPSSKQSRATTRNTLPSTEPSTTRGCRRRTSSKNTAET